MKKLPVERLIFFNPSSQGGASDAEDLETTSSFERTSAEEPVEQADA